MPLLDDYAGLFESDLGLASFSRPTLARLGREFLLNGHLQDRVGLPLVAKRFGPDAYVTFSIEEWMAASPVYSERMQKALGFEGSDVATVFKNLQLDIGAPHQFMDFQFLLERSDYGEFWLPHCGALMDVERFGEQSVTLMCHQIEDPTFDATAAATHPCMKMRPIHRPPRVPADRVPHCRWSVFIGDEAEPVEMHPNLDLVRESLLAKIPIEIPERQAESGGWEDYADKFDPGFQLEDLSHNALLIVCQEFAIQSHLLARAFMLCASQREGDEAALELGSAQWTGIAALTARRLAKSLKIEGGGIEDIAKIFQIHPCFHPRSYVDLRVELDGTDRLRVSLGDCPALNEGDAHSWFATLSQDSHPAIDAIAWTIDPRAFSRASSDPGDARFAWDIEIDAKADPRPAPQELNLADLSRGATFEFERRRSLRA
ncbi:MAG: hypothetical protein CL908_23260 [Deltaproteobacteria bacterium]|nr:hypothetical protein [Deltaproteobacteria bacterium]